MLYFKKKCTQYFFLHYRIYEVVVSDTTLHSYTTNIITWHVVEYNIDIMTFSISVYIEKLCLSYRDDGRRNKNMYRIPTTTEKSRSEKKYYNIYFLLLSTCTNI